MKKKLFGIISFLVIATLLVSGCKKTEYEVFSEPEEWKQAVKPQPQVEDSVPAKSETEPEVEIRAEGDPALVALEVTEDFAKTNGCLCLYRKGKLYSLGPYVPCQTMYDYYIGHRETDDRAKLLEWTTEELYTMGDTPEICLKDGDELRSYGPGFTFSKVDFVGYTIKGWRSGGAVFIPYLNKPTVYPRGEVTVLDQGGNAVEWPSTFPHMSIYTIEWYEGVDYHSYDMQADSKMYVRAAEPLSMKPDEEVTKNGYAILDYSSFPSGGIYCDLYASTLPMTIQ